MEEISCTLCSRGNFTFQNILEHYAKEHKIEESNELLISQLTSLTLPNKTKVESCIICQEVMDNIRQKSRHMLYMHHRLGSEEINNLPIKKTAKFLEGINF